MRSQGPSTNRLRTIRSLLDSGADPEISDLFGQRCSDWVPRRSYNVDLATRVRIDGARHPKPLPSIAIESFERLHAAIVTVVVILLDLEESVQRTTELPATHMWLQILGHMSIMADEDEEASTVFGQAISETSFKTAAGSINWIYPCDQPKALEKCELFLSGYFFGCYSCSSVSLCSFCLEGLTYEETRTRKVAATCAGHFYVARSTADRCRRPRGVVNQHLETRAQWLNRLLRTYNCHQVLPCPTRHAAIGDDAEISEEDMNRQTDTML